MLLIYHCFQWYYSIEEIRRRFYEKNKYNNSVLDCRNAIFFRTEREKSNNQNQSWQDHHETVQ